MLVVSILRESAAECRMADDDIMQGGLQRRHIQRPLEADDIGFVERAVCLIAHLHGMEDLPLGLGGRSRIEAGESGGSRSAALA